jgi:DNA-binding LacI/PurR family transcriptional regulator
MQHGVFGYHAAAMTPKRTRATSFDVAALAGVSQSAVSRAFSSHSIIAPATRARVLEAARQLDYVPNSIASSLTTQKTNIVAVIVGDMANPFYIQALRRFSHRLQEQGRQVLLFTVDRGVAADDVMRRVLQYQVDGVLLTSAQLSMRMTSLSLDRGIPVVLFNRYVPGHEAACVRCDNAHGGGLIAEAFLRLGGRRYAMITGDPGGATSQDRVRGFVERLHEAGMAAGDIAQAAGYATYEGCASAVHALFGGPRGTWPNALFCINDIMALGAMDELRFRLGAAIPGDVAVAGFDDIPEASRLAYQLTTVTQPVDDMVAEAISLLHLDGPPSPIERAVDRALPGRLIERATLATVDGRTMRALSDGNARSTGPT